LRETVSDVDLVIEAIPENVELKEATFKDVNMYASPHTDHRFEHIFNKHNLALQQTTVKKSAGCAHKCSLICFRLVLAFLGFFLGF
jgi:hypothetical protein